MNFNPIFAVFLCQLIPAAPPAPPPPPTTPTFQAKFRATWVSGGICEPWGQTLAFRATLFLTRNQNMAKQEFTGKDK